MTTHHTLLSLPLPLSLTYFKHLQRTSLSLSALQALYKRPHPSSRSLSLSPAYFEHLQRISLSLCTPRRERERVLGLAQTHRNQLGAAQTGLARPLSHLAKMQ